MELGPQQALSTNLGIQWENVVLAADMHLHDLS
jgi:hypothetical protein